MTQVETVATITVLAAATIQVAMAAAITALAAATTRRIAHIQQAAITVLAA